MTDDMTLLRQYAEGNSEEAFAALVSRYVNLVYSVALRQVYDPHLAEEVTQTAFIILARKAKSLHAKTVLSGWLCRTARYVSANALTMQRRRRDREQEAHMQSVLNESDPDLWTQIAPLLEAALAQLGKTDHDAIVLRFFEGKIFSEVGEALDMSEDAAKKRVNRAVEKLRTYFSKRGVTLSAGALAAVVTANSVQAAPAALAKTATAVAFVKGATASGSSITLIKGALKTMAWTKAKTSIVATALAIATLGPVAWYYTGSHAAGAWRQRFEAAYRLKEGENVKHIQEPFMPERAQYYHNDETLRDQAKAIKHPPSYFTFHQDNQGLHEWGLGFGNASHSLQEVLHDVFGLNQYEIQGPRDLLNLNISGDWTIRDGTNIEALLSGLEDALRNETKRNIHFEKRDVEREVIVARGQSTVEVGWDQRIHVYAENSKDAGAGGGSGNVSEFLKRVGDELGFPIINEVSGDGQKIFSWENHFDANFAHMGKRRDELTDDVLRNLSTQTGISFAREQQSTQVWFVTEQR
jgi:RNA polymerase sigma factor (sigma-70 family)